MIHEIKTIIRPSRLDAVMDALHAIPGMPGVAMSRVHGYVRLHPHDADPAPRGTEADFVRLET
ncbi:MAG: hypothetical protein K2Y23_25580 [Cyanobacteria bacterium]|nr:hypothetical protein [Cyanobacteriota bacterium]